MTAEADKAFRLVDSAPDEQVLEILEELLNDARRGDVLAIGVVTHRRGGDCHLAVSASAFRNAFSMMGGLHHCADLISEEIRMAGEED